jgi:outer membrane receptor for ferric coprogen and ferric-rhodotorulic acid
MNRAMTAVAVWACACAQAAPVLANEPVAEEVTVVGYVSRVTVGGKQAQTLREIPNSVSVLTRQRIEDQNLTTIADALTQVPGITVISNDSTQSQYRSRGYNMGLMNDGIPAYSALSGYQQPDLAVYERVEVLRGPAGVLNGTGDPGGVVNMVQKRAEEDFGLRASVSGGSWDQYRGTADVTGRLFGDVRGRAVVAYQDRDFFTRGSSNERATGYGTLAWDATASTTLEVSLLRQKDETFAPYGGLPAQLPSGELLDVPRSTNLVPEWSRYLWDTNDYTLQLSQGLGENWSLRARASRREQRFYFKDAYATTGVNVAGNVNYARRVRDYDYTRDSWDVYLSGGLDLFGQRHEVLVGYNRDDFNSIYEGVNGTAVNNVPFGRPDLVPDFDTPYNLGGETENAQSGFYAQARVTIREPFTVVLGGRLSDFETRTRAVAPGTPGPWTVGRNAADGEFTPYAGVVYDVTRMISLYASYADVFIPQTQQRFDGSVIDSRVGKQYEVGAKAEFFDRRLNASVALFNLRDTGRAFADAAHPTFFVNAGEVESKGWEIEAVGSLWEGYEVQAGYTRLDTVYLRDAVNAGLVFDTWEPGHLVKLWGVRRFAGGALEGLTVGLGGNYSARTRSGNGASAIRDQDSFVVVNAMVGYRFGDHVSLSLNLNNLLDETYYTRLGGTNTYNSYGEPFSATVGVSVSF